MFERIKTWAKQLKRKVFVLYFACKDTRTPCYAKVFAICVVAYAFSPIDLIPDFIPILGYLDDVILIPLGVAFAVKMMPKSMILGVYCKSRETNEEWKTEKLVCRKFNYFGVDNGIPMDFFFSLSVFVQLTGTA